MIRISTFVFATLLLSSLAIAQMQMPKPGPELKKLDYFSGNWTCDGDSKPGPMGPGGKMTMTQDSKWMDGGFFVVMHTKYKSPMGDGNGLAIMGYDSSEKKYTYNEFNSDGEALFSKGTVDGDAWTWIGEMKEIGGKGKFSEKILSPTSYSFMFEMSTDGSKWTPIMDGKCTKK